MAYTPRTNSNGMQDNFHWYSQNPFYQSGYGLPNCTCYSYGRVWEYSDPNNDGSNKPTHLSLGDGGQWYAHAISDGFYQVGSEPALRSGYLL